MSLTVAAYTLGCKVNQYETEAILEQFSKRGATIVEPTESADVYIINTCTVTSLSDRKSRQMIRRARHLNPAAVIVVMGCYAQTAPEEVSKIAEVDLVIGTDGRLKAAELVEDFLKNREKRVVVNDISQIHEFEDLSITHYENRTRAIMKVQEGCNRFCSYCIIPYARGRIRSRSIESSVKEAKRLADAGFCEIVLVGIHLASYGKESGETDLLDLIKHIAEIDGIDRIRLGSLEPTIFTEEFTQAASQIPKLCHHFHLSLQSGCDMTLERMNRKYTTKEYAEVLDRIRKAMPDSAIATDIMVGFAGETEDEFNATCNFVKEIKLSDAHIFKYSIRKGTRAAKMDGQVDPKVKEERSKTLIKITSDTRKEFLEKFINTEADVLFEQYHNNKKGLFEGKTSNYITVVVNGGEELEGKMRRVRMLREENGIVFGELVEESI
ncbi:MAG: tRNA (N(6)-L-threonylcarbamoyladenosine(37)-C(2))-methylthiotransferase MtaB [Clostridia bacterium]|nr:tRNA (N(6)-L-threonylcarbamoyladenosine(37)-C(2))-methylthiotransferase MtaB [Clostridia bacterium]